MYHLLKVSMANISAGKSISVIHHLLRVRDLLLLARYTSLLVAALHLSTMGFPAVLTGHCSVMQMVPDSNTPWV